MQPEGHENEIIISLDLGKNSLIITVVMRESSNDSEKAISQKITTKELWELEQ